MRCTLEEVLVRPGEDWPLRVLEKWYRVPVSGNNPEESVLSLFRFLPLLSLSTSHGDRQDGRSFYLAIFTTRQRRSVESYVAGGKGDVNFLRQRECVREMEG